jgi:hypothetical protein
MAQIEMLRCPDRVPVFRHKVGSGTDPRSRGVEMNQYLLSVYDGGPGGPATPEEMHAFMGRVIALEEEMDEAGAFVFGGALHGSDAATVVRGGTGLDKVTTDGPFVEAKEHIGGFYVINAEDLDAALAWAEKVVEAIDHDIEVRPFRATGRVQAGH